MIDIRNPTSIECPVVGCGYIQKDWRIPDLKYHDVTRDRWVEPEEWTRCGVGTEIVHLYGRGAVEGMTEEEQIAAGAYLLRGRMMIGGRLKAFLRRDALSRHVNNPNVSCVGHGFVPSPDP